MPATESSDYLGTPSFAIRVQYLKASLALLIAGAKRLQLKKIVHAEMFENSITASLASEMIAEQRVVGSDIIRFDFRVHHLSNPLDPGSVCEIDFKFTWDSYDYEAYLAAEAKLLRGAGKSLAGKYVTEGMMDFVLGKYGRGHSYGIMIGYVIVAPLDNAVTKVLSAMSTRKAATFEDSPCQSDSNFCSHPYTHLSRHLQLEQMNSSTLIHIFFDFTMYDQNQGLKEH